MSLVRADAIAIPLADESVDLVVTSPPYFALRSYTDGGEHYAGQIGSEPTPQDFLEALWAVTAECVRVLKPSGSIWVNLGDKYAGSGGHNNGGIAKPDKKRKGWDGANNPMTTAANVASRRSAPDSYNKATIGGARPKSLMGLPWRYAIGCMDQLGLILRRDQIWSKPNGLPESVTDRCRSSHEYWFHFTKEPRYFAAVDEIREPSGADHHRTVAPKVTHADGQPPLLMDRTARNPLGKLPGSVWTIPSEPLKVPDWLDVDHFAAFPQEWPRRIILGWSPSAYCTKCDEPRRPVAATETTSRVGGNQNNGRRDATADASWSYTERTTTTTITGYACACDVTTAPTRPAVVLDPFGGTGTVAMVARALGRYPVHIDLSADYLRLARWRIYDSGHAAKSAARTNRERQGVLL